MACRGAHAARERTRPHAPEDTRASAFCSDWQQWIPGNSRSRTISTLAMTDGRNDAHRRIRSNKRRRLNATPGSRRGIDLVIGGVDKLAVRRQACLTSVLTMNAACRR
jgi:hypothetical protein